MFFEFFFFFVAATELYLNRHSKPQTHLAHHPAKTIKSTSPSNYTWLQGWMPFDSEWLNMGIYILTSYIINVFFARAPHLNSCFILICCLCPSHGIFVCVCCFLRLAHPQMFNCFTGTGTRTRSKWPIFLPSTPRLPSNITKVESGIQTQEEKHAPMLAPAKPKATGCGPKSPNIQPPLTSMHGLVA